MTSPRPVYSILTLIAALASCDRPAPNAANWLMYGRTPDNQRFSPLDQINEQNVSKLGLMWSRELGTTRGLEATPIVENGTIYTTGTWSVVFAIDAKTGEVRWKYDPQVPRDRAYFICCDVVNRGVALEHGKIYVATLDGRLIALDAASGMPVWTSQTTPPDKPYSITAAPRVVRNLVIIGNAGSEYGVRGYISAYDADTGKQVWRTYTVPGDPSKGFESKALEEAAKSWSGDWWTVGGGGTPWEGTSYDPTLDLLYFGTGNASAWYRALRGNGNGDNLFTACILAVHASTGEVAWHFQTTPGDNWDFDATQPLMLADLTIAGRERKLIMQANKNGFFYVLDRQTGEFISGAPFAGGINWASGLDAKSGRPLEATAGYDGLKPVLVSPHPAGAHNWDPMAFSPATGLVYLSAKSGEYFVHAPDAKWKYDPDRGNVGSDAHYEGALHAKLAAMPPPTGELVAWNPVQQRATWRVNLGPNEGGGVLATAGNLVFQGRSDGTFAAFRATDGKQLWQFDAGTGIMAPAVTYLIDGIQYVSVMVGWGGPDGLNNDPFHGKSGYGRLLTFASGDTARLNAPAFGHTGLPPAPPIKMNASPKMIHEGGVLFNAECAGCHGVNAVAGPLPDLRYASNTVHEQFQEIVLGGARASLGMPSFKKIFTPEQVRAIQAYILSRAKSQP